MFPMYSNVSEIRDSNSSVIRQFSSLLPGVPEGDSDTPIDFAEHGLYERLVGISLNVGLAHQYAWISHLTAWELYLWIKNSKRPTIDLKCSLRDELCVAGVPGSRGLAADIALAILMKRKPCFEDYGQEVKSIYKKAVRRLKKNRDVLLMVLLAMVRVEQGEPVRWSLLRFQMY